MPAAPQRIEYWSLTRPKPDARNAKTHDTDQVAKFADSIRGRACRATETDAWHRHTSSFSISTARHKNRKRPSHPNKRANRTQSYLGASDNFGEIR